jgi:hypothetical protein
MIIYHDGPCVFDLNHVCFVVGTCGPDLGPLSFCAIQNAHSRDGDAEMAETFSENLMRALVAETHFLNCHRYRRKEPNDQKADAEVTKNAHGASPPSRRWFSAQIVTPL